MSLAIIGQKLLAQDPRTCPDQASVRLVGHSDLEARLSSLESRIQPHFPLELEMRIVKDYLNIQKTRFGDRLRYCVDIPDETAELAVPPLSVQSLVDNAVKHAIGPLAGGGEVQIVARRDAAALR